MNLELIDPFAPAFWHHILVTLFCGGIIGLERQLRGKAAGIRTSILICLGTQTYIALSIAGDLSQVDPTRVLGQVVTGVGFIGGGLIMAREGHLEGVTSAAIIWGLAAIGSLIGFGHHYAAIALSLVTVGILVGVELLESIFLKLRPGQHGGHPYIADRLNPKAKLRPTRRRPSEEM